MTDVSTAPPELNAVVLLIAVGRRARGRVDEVLTSHHIGYGHLSALGHLTVGGEMSYSELARRASVTAQSMQATLTRLEKLGIVERAGATGQGQRARLVVTPEGRRLMTTCRQALVDIEAEILGDLPPKRRDLLRGLLAELFSMNPTTTHSA